MKFRSDSGGYVTGVRFYKGATNTGVARREPLDRRRARCSPRATFTDEIGDGLAAGELRDAGADQREHHLRRLVPHQRRALLVHDERSRDGGRQPADARAGERRPRRPERCLPLRRRQRVPDDHRERRELLRRRRVRRRAADQRPLALPRRHGRRAVDHGDGDVQRSRDPASIAFSRRRRLEQPVAGTTSYNATTQTATFTPSAPLNPLDDYTATVSGAIDAGGGDGRAVHVVVHVGGAFRSTSSTARPQPTRSTFRRARPRASPSTSAIVPSTVSFTVHDTTNHLVPGSIDFASGNTVARFTPTAPLAAGTTYSVVVSGGQTADQKAMPAPASWSFTTTAPPTVTSRVPAPNSTGISLGTSITINYSRPVVVGSPAGRGRRRRREPGLRNAHPRRHEHDLDVRPRRRARARHDVLGDGLGCDLTGRRGR